MPHEWTRCAFLYQHWENAKSHISRPHFEHLQRNLLSKRKTCLTATPTFTSSSCLQCISALATFSSTLFLFHFLQEKGENTLGYTRHRKILYLSQNLSTVWNLFNRSEFSCKALCLGLRPSISQRKLAPGSGSTCSFLLPKEIRVALALLSPDELLQEVRSPRRLWDRHLEETEKFLLICYRLTELVYRRLHEENQNRRSACMIKFV